jgi:hypothetical protein
MAIRTRFFIQSSNWKIASEVPCKDTWKQNQLTLKQKMKPLEKSSYNNAKKSWHFVFRIETKPKKF